MYAEGGLHVPFLPLLASPATANHSHYCCYSMNSPFPCEDTMASFQQLACGTQMQMEMFQAEYDLGGEGDLFKAPKTVTEEPVTEFDPITATVMSIMSCGDDVLTAESIQVADIESFTNDHLSDVFYECQKDLIEKSMIQEPTSELLDVKFPGAQPAEGLNSEKFNFPEDTSMQKSVSSGCLNTMDWICGYPSFLGFQLEAFGMRRAYSEGDIQNLYNNTSTTSMAHPSTAHSSSEQSSIINDPKTEERRQKLSRYLKKKAQRNFGRKIKYACRKALADNQPRVRGRFAKAECSEASKTETSR